MISDADGPSLYDFRQAHSLSADQSRELHDHCVNLCRALQRAVPETTGVAVRFATERLQATTYDDYLDGLPDSPILAICEHEPEASPIVWQLDVGLALAYMDAMLGGDGVSVVTDDRELTVLERTLVGQIVEEFLSTWADAWPGLESVGPQVLEVRQTTGRFATGALQEAVVALVIGCSVGEATGQMRVALPTVLLRGLLKQPGSVSRNCYIPGSPSATAREMTRCPVVVAACLARARMSAADLHRLRPGDLIPLDRSPRDPLEVVVAGLPKFKGISGLVNDRLAVRISDTLRC